MSVGRWPLSPAAVALELVDPGEQPLATRLLSEDPAFRAEVTRLRAATAALASLDADVWSPQPPPALERRASGTDAARTPDAPPARRRVLRGRRPVIGALIAAAAAVAAIVITTSGHDDPVPAPPPTTLALRPLAGASGRAQLTVNSAGTEAELRTAGLRPSGAHHYYEAWLADDRGRMVSMGTFRVPSDGRVDVHMAIAVDVADYTLVDVSLEPDDGDPAHSDRSVLRARL